MNIVHISPTPLVASPGKIANAQRLVGHNSVCMILNDYPEKGPLFKKFIDDSIIFNNETRDFLIHSISLADIIHVHNNCPKNIVQLILDINKNALFVYQIHSPMREGPVYIDRTKTIGLPFEKFLVVGQHWAKLYPKYIPVPNIINFSPSLNLRRNDEKLRVAFSPTHKHQGRWTSKNSELLNKTLDALVNLDVIKLIKPNAPVAPNVLMYMRRSAHLTIDEIATGGYHQVSIEGMCAGNVVINGADFFAKKAYSKFSDGELPPFVFASDFNIKDILWNFVNDVSITNEYQKKSYNFFQSYLSPERLVNFFDKAYKS